MQGLHKYFGGKDKTTASKSPKKSPQKPQSGKSTPAKNAKNKAGKEENKKESASRSQSSKRGKAVKESKEKSKSPSERVDSKDKPKTRKRLLRGKKENDEDDYIDMDEDKIKGQTPDEYFDKFANKTLKGAKGQRKKSSPRKNKSDKSTPKKGKGSKPTTKRGKKRVVSDDEDFEVDKEPSNDDSDDLKDIVEEGDSSEEEVVMTRTQKKGKKTTPKKAQTFEQKKKSPKKAVQEVKQQDDDDESIGGNIVESYTPLEDLTFVISGVFENIARARLEEFIKELGGRLTSAVSGKTDYLLIGSKLEDGREITTGSKYRKAKEKGVPILDETQSEDFFKRQLDNQYFTWENHQLWKDKKACKNKTLAASRAVPQPEIATMAPGHHMQNMLLTDKYKPVKPTDLVGNKGNIDSLIKWLKDWDDIHIRGNKKQTQAFKGNWQNAPRVNAKAAMISGPPGIGKTSTARIVCRDLGFEIVEMNASDTRNKKTIQSLVRELSTNNSIEYYTTAGKNRDNSKKDLISTHKKSVIIMDEVDGCGGGDRGGIAALIQVIKVSKTPIICICNDRDNRKLMSLINHCYEIRFTRPSAPQIVKRINQIAKAEGLEIEENAITLLVEQSGNDIRQLITQIQIASSTTKSLTYKDVCARVSNISKDQKLMINNFQAANRLMDSSKFSTMSYREKLDMFFIDYDFVPLLVQENYLSAFDQGFNQRKKADVQRLANAASFIAHGDVINKRIRGDMEWTLLSDSAFASSIAPCHYTQGGLNFPRFPEWLGKNSSSNKSKRLINELKQSMGHRVQCDRMTMQNEYLPIIFDAIFKEIKKDNIDEAIDLMDEMNISNEQFREHVLTLIFDKKKTEQLNKMNTKSKSAFTRAYNATHKTTQVTKKKKKEETAVVEDDQFDPEIDEEPPAEDKAQDSEEEDEAGKDLSDEDFDIVKLNKPNAGKAKGKGGKKAKADDKKATKAKSKGKKKK